ncbi:MAG: DUF4919 domain-containing protein [Alistipes sp.]|nr:DUF4919 domain-containing protein [Alistipes sp.]
MRRLAFVILAMAATGAAAGAGLPTCAPPWLEAIAPGFDTVATNPVEYKKILDKFATTIHRPSVSDCAIAYYGSPLQPGFTPFIADEEEMQRAIMADDYATAFTIGNSLLEQTPVNLTTLYWTLYAATETDQPWEVRNSLRGRYNSIVHTLSLSGDGTSADTALHVVWESDMYTYTMLELGLEIGEGYLWDERWTQFEVSPGAPNGLGTPGRLGAPPRGAGYKHPSIFFELWTGTPPPAGTPAAD